MLCYKLIYITIVNGGYKSTYNTWFANFRPPAALVRDQRDQVASIAAALERGAKLWQHEPWTKLGLSLLVMLNVIIINLPGSYSWDILKHWDSLLTLIFPHFGLMSYIMMQRASCHSSVWMLSMFSVNCPISVVAPILTHIKLGILRSVDNTFYFHSKFSQRYILRPETGLPLARQLRGESRTKIEFACPLLIYVQHCISERTYHFFSWFSNTESTCIL